ncbi:hypothetical protein [Thiomicrorhabdus sp.]|uniref:hypothetical protein n=1 Tax=Thiomicrorhabdus sp. TaxID=2039724 RepID=UPI0035690A17
MQIKLIGLVLSGLVLAQTATVAQAGVWENIKADAAEAWQSTKETASSMAGDISESSKEGYENAKKLGDKETYSNAWADIKNSVKNPSSETVDEAGIPEK